MIFIDIIAGIISESLGQVFGKSLLEEIDEKTLNRNISKAIERAHADFREEHGKIDKEIVDVLTLQTRFDDLPSVRQAIITMLRRPIDPAREIEILRSSFTDVLPKRFPPERVEKAIMVFLEKLFREILYIPQLNQLYSLLYLKANAENSQRAAYSTAQIAELLQQITSNLPLLIRGDSELGGSGRLLLPPQDKIEAVSTARKTTNTEKAIDLIRHIDQTEKLVREMRIFLSKHRGQPNLAKEAELRRHLVKQDELIVRLDECLESPVEIKILLPEFEKIFQYDLLDNNSLAFATKLKGTAEKLVSLAWGMEDVSLLSLTNTLGAINYTLGQTDLALYYLVEQSLPMVQLFEQKKKIGEVQAAEIYFAIYDRVCALEVSFLSKYHDWAQSHPLKNHRQYWITTVETCSACRYLRRDQLAMAKSHLEAAIENIRILQKEESDPDMLRERLAYLCLILSIYHFKQGSQHYKKAKKQLKLYIKYAEGLPVDTYSSGYVSYLLYKIYEETGNKLESLFYRKNAQLLLSNTLIREFCMFDYQKVLDELNKVEEKASK